MLVLDQKRGFDLAVDDSGSSGLQKGELKPRAGLWRSLYLDVYKRQILKHIKPIFILFLPQLATEVYVVLDKTMLGLLASDISQVGYYTQASKIVKLCLAIITSLGTVMLPAMSFAFSKGDEQLIKNSVQSAFRFVFMIGFCLLYTSVWFFNVHDNIFIEAISLPLNLLLLQSWIPVNLSLIHI